MDKTKAKGGRPKGPAKVKVTLTLMAETAAKATAIATRKNETLSGYLSRNIERSIGEKS